jgi:hypothetical protein
LVGIQALKNNKDKSLLISAISSVSSWITEQIPNKELRTVFASTGLNLVSCQSLNESIEQFTGYPISHFLFVFNSTNDLFDFKQESH